MVARNRNQGELETAVLSALWDAAEEAKSDTEAGKSSALTSQEVLKRVAPDGSLAITTVLTVLSRLVDKQLVMRHQGNGRALLFSAATSSTQHDADLLLKIFEASSNPLLAFSHFAKSLTPDQLQQLRQSLKQD